MSTPAKTTVPQLKTKVSGEQVLFTEGIASKIWKYRSGVAASTQKPYSFQDIVLADPANPNETFKVTFNDCPEIKTTFVGKICQLLCTKSDQHGFTGVKIKEVDGYPDKAKKELVLWVTKSATIVGLGIDGGTGGAPAEAPAQPAPKPAPQSTPVPTAQVAPPVQPGPVKTDTAQTKTTAERVLGVKKKITKSAHLWVLCLLARDYADSLYRDATGNCMTLEERQTCISTFFLRHTKDAWREDGFRDLEMPDATEFPKYLPKPEAK